VEQSNPNFRRLAGWALVAGLTLAALTAAAALMVGDIDDTELRVILTSIGFALSSSVAATGAAQQARPAKGLRLVGLATAALAIAAFALLVAGFWTDMDEWGSEGVWRAFGTTAVLALAGCHACLVLGARRRSDSQAVTAIVTASLVLAAVDAAGAVAPIAGLTDDVSEETAKLLATALVLLVLTSVLPPIVRRLAPAASTRPNGPRENAIERLSGEVEAIADRIDELNRGPAIRAPEIRREVERLRRLARSFSP
jgi:hypothetical protein